MKKIISFLILFFLPIFVLADTMFPVYAGYNAKVNSEDGVYLYDYTEDKLLKITDIHLDNDTKIYVKDEIEVTKNVYYGAVEYNCDSNGNCETYYINLNKIVKTGEDKVYSPDELNKEIKDRFGANNVSNLEKINKPAISVKKGLNIYNYPSYTAKKLSYTISLYEEFTAVSFIPKNGEGIDAWFYIKNSKIEGWVNYKDGLAYNKQGTYEFTSGMQTYKDMECENESSYSVPSDSTLKGNNVYQLLLHSVEETYKDDSPTNPALLLSTTSLDSVTISPA